MSEVYALAVDGFLPHLRFLRVYVNRSIIKTVLLELSSTTSLRMRNLETFDLYLKQRCKPNEGGEEEVEWPTVETLTSPSVMPRLRQFSLIYTLSTSAEIRQISQFLLHNIDRHIRTRFAFCIPTATPINAYDAANLHHIRSTYPNDFLVQDVSIFPL